MARAVSKRDKLRYASLRKLLSTLLLMLLLNLLCRQLLEPLHQLPERFLCLLHLRRGGLRQWDGCTQRR